jgi:hypothetical protein
MESGERSLPRVSISTKAATMGEFQSNAGFERGRKREPTKKRKRKTFICRLVIVPRKNPALRFARHSTTREATLEGLIDPRQIAALIWG